MKKILLILSVFFLFVGIVPHVFAETAQGFTALAPIPGLTDAANTSVVNSKSLSDFFNNLYKYLIGIAAILAVIEIIWAGFNIATNKDNVSVLMSSKGKISQAILGLVLVLSPVLVFSIINPSILNLSLNLPALNNAPVTQGGGGVQVDSGVANCVVTKGPINADGTYLITCTASAPDTSGKQTPSDLKNAAETKVEESLGSMSVDCIGKSNKIWKTISNECPVDTASQGNSSLKICIKATATAWCSPIVTTSVVQQIKKGINTPSGFTADSYTDKLYYSGSATDADGAVFANACTGLPWKLTHNKSSDKNAPTVDCPINDQKYKDLPYQNLLRCVSVPVYCKYK